MKSATIQRKIEKLLRGLVTSQDLKKKYKVTDMSIVNWRRRGLPAVVLGRDGKGDIVRFVPIEVEAWRKKMRKV